MAKKKKALYTGLFLNDASSAIVLNLMQAEGHERLPKVHAHHLTFKFKPSLAEVQVLPIGKEVVFSVVGFAADEKGQAVLCKLPDDVKGFCTNADPHVTVSVADGVSPVYSNELLADGPNVTMLSEPVLLVGRIGFFDGKENQFDFGGSIYA